MTAYITKINNGKVELWTTTGNRYGSISSINNAISADYNDHLQQIVITVITGKVYTYNKSGSRVHTVYQSSPAAVDAGWVGDDLQITLANNTTYLYKANGTRIRRI